MQRSFGRTLTVASLALVLVFVHSAAQAQYQVKRLVFQKGADPTSTLVNAWGLTRGRTSPFWISDNGTGLSTLYTGAGAQVPLTVNIPPGAATVAAVPNGTAKGSPTGIVFNGSQEFTVTDQASNKSGTALFLFATFDGTISGWSPGVDLHNAFIAVDNSAKGTFYTGLAVTNHATTPNFLYAADNANNKVDVYDGSFTLVTTLTDSTIPKGFAAYGIRDINGRVYLTYASTGNAPGGFIDVFRENGKLIKRLISSGALNQPWGLALAPAEFGPFSHALLVGNNTPGGVINAFDVTTGKSLGRLHNIAHKLIMIDQLWGLDFGGGTAVNGESNQLFFTAGPSNYANGLFGRIEVEDFDGD